MPEIKVTIPGTPIAKKRPRFARRGKFVTTYNEQQTEEGKFILLAIQQIKEKAPQGVPVELICRFVFPVPKSLTKKAWREIVEQDYAHVKKPDGDNCLKFVKDCLNGVAWHDDSQVWFAECRKIYDEEARTELIIHWEDRINHTPVPGVMVRTGNVGDF